MSEQYEHDLNQHLDKQDEMAFQLAEFRELTQPFFNNIEEALFYIRKEAESFSEIDLDEEIKQSILEML